jgi:hypothetical protein
MSHVWKYCALLTLILTLMGLSRVVVRGPLQGRTVPSYSPSRFYLWVIKYPSIAQCRVIVLSPWFVVCIFHVVMNIWGKTGWIGIRIMWSDISTNVSMWFHPRRLLSFVQFTPINVRNIHIHVHAYSIAYCCRLFYIGEDFINLFSVCLILFSHLSK